MMRSRPALSDWKGLFRSAFHALRAYEVCKALPDTIPPFGRLATSQEDVMCVQELVRLMDKTVRCGRGKLRARAPNRQLAVAPM